MNGSPYFYAVISTDGCHCYREPVAAMQHAEFMSSVGSELVFYLAYQPDGGEVELLERMSYRDLMMANNNVVMRKTIDFIMDGMEDEKKEITIFERQSRLE